MLSAYRTSGRVASVLVFDDRIGHGDADCVNRHGQTVSFEEARLLTSLEHPNGTLDFAPQVGTSAPAAIDAGDGVDLIV